MTDEPRSAPRTALAHIEEAERLLEGAKAAVRAANPGDGSPAEMRRYNAEIDKAAFAVNAASIHARLAIARVERVVRG